MTNRFEREFVGVERREQDNRRANNFSVVGINETVAELKNPEGRRLDRRAFAVEQNHVPPDNQRRALVLAQEKFLGNFCAALSIVAGNLARQVAGVVDVKNFFADVKIISHELLNRLPV